MNKLMRFALVLLMFMACLGMLTAAELDRSLSDARLAGLEKLVDETLSANPDIVADELVPMISNAFKALEPCLSATKRPPLILEPDSQATAERLLTEEALKLYPNYSVPELRQKSAEVYPLYKVNQTVTVVYKKTPRLTETVHGIYMGTLGENVVVNSRKIRLGDMKGIEGNDGPDGEIVKYDQIANQRLREQWMDDYISNSAVERKKFEDEHREEFLNRQNAEDFLTNQRNGYTFWEGQWFTADSLVREYASQAVSTARRVKNAKEAEYINRGNAEITSQMEMTSQTYAISPIGKLPNVEGVLAKQADEEQKRKELEAQQAREEEELREREEEAAREAELAAQREKERESQPVRQPVAPPVVEEEGKPIWLYVVIGAVIVGVIGFGAWMFFFHHEKELDVSKFYKSKGDFQEGFWAAADADPENFKYVAYLFDNVDAAKNALCQLSFVGLGVNGELKSKRGDIILGAYSHQNRAVAVIGGNSLNYARWREASMVWPELPNAAYFRQSSEPKVKLVMPSAEELSRQEGLEVEKLGAEDIRTESGEINRVFRYRCANRESALRFLALFKVEEEGIVVRVETAEGEFGKDINGVFTV